MQNNYSGLIDLRTTFKEQDGKLYIAQSQNCTAIAEDAKRRHNEGHHGSSEMKHAARIPHVIIEKYMNETGVSFMEVMGSSVHIKRIVENPDNAAFRIWKGAL